MRELVGERERERRQSAQYGLEVLRYERAINSVNLKEDKDIRKYSALNAFG